MQFPTLPAWAKVALGTAGAFAVVGGTVGLTAAVTSNGLNPPPTQAAAPTAAPYSPAPASTPPSTPNPAARAVAVAVLEAEAQVLGLQPKELRADFRAGTTVQALAAQRSITEAQFQTQLTADVKPLLDQDVQQGTITSTQEQSVLRRLGRVIPNWAHVGAARQQPSPTPTP
jgi:membrane-bound lytic murein transglycosylase B